MISVSGLGIKTSLLTLKLLFQNSLVLKIYAIGSFSFRLLIKFLNSFILLKSILFCKFINNSSLDLFRTFASINSLSNLKLFICLDLSK